MRICIIADQIYKSGGIERVLSHRILYWLNNGYQVHLITSENNGNDSYFSYDSRMIHHDILGGFDKSVSLFSPANLISASKYFFKLKKRIDNIKPDVVVMTNYNYDYYLLPLIVRDTYIIKEYHSSFSKGNNLIGILKDYYTKFYHAHVFLSQEEADLASIPNSFIIPNPIATTTNCPTQLSERQKTILTAGRIVSIKGFERLIESWAKIAEKYPDWHLEIYGDGDPSYIESLELLISQKNISTNSAIYSSTPHMSKKMLNSRIYAMSSLTECFPMVLLEAMQSKMAVLAFDCPTGPRNIIENYKNGILVENNNIDSFSLALENLINNENIAQEIANNGFVESKQYDVNVVMKRWNALINKEILER